MTMISQANPHDYCPVCGGRFTRSCRCRRGNRWCAQGHGWHRCKIHDVAVFGSGHDVPLDQCSCPPAGPKADFANAVDFAFDLAAPVARFSGPGGG